MDFQPIHEIHLQYGMYEDGEFGVVCYDDGVPLVTGLGMLEAAKTAMNEAMYDEEDHGW